MVLLKPTLNFEASTLILQVPSTPDAPSSSHSIPFAAPADAEHHHTFQIWGSQFDGYEVGTPELLCSLSDFMGRPVLLILKGDTPRAAGVFDEWRQSDAVAPVYGEGNGTPTTLWSDMAPVLIVSEESRRKVADMIAREGKEHKGFDGERWDGKEESLEIERWRGNVVVEGVGEPWEEDSWAEIQFERPGGERVEWFISSRCARCISSQLPNVDPASGIRDKVVPDKLLRPSRENVWPFMASKIVSFTLLQHLIKDLIFEM
ncbi:hypothetical protein P7C70_g7998, partial [Phenoliferia sp. Uapishka_3]